MKSATVTAAVLLSAALASTTASAGFLNFNELGLGELKQTERSVQGADIRTPNGTGLYSGEFFTNAGGSICAAIRLNEQTLSCTGDLFIDFTDPIRNLSFQAIGDDRGDGVTISAFNRNNELLGFKVIEDDKAVTFDELSDITRLSFIDNSTGAGYAYGLFKFDTVSTAIPEPATGLLVGLGLLAVVAATTTGRRRRLR